MADDPYTVLGVARTATDDEIRRRYRTLVKELHPDVNPAKSAEERFKKVTVAFDIVGDPVKRKAFDRGEIDAAGDPRRSAGPRPGAGPGGGFGGARWNAGQGGFDSDDPFGDIFAGFRGAGAQARARRGQDARYTIELDFTEAALGAVKRVTMPGGDTLDLNVPSGVVEGQMLRLKGKGQPGFNGGPAGDALVEIRIRAHATFKRTGDDVALDVPLTLDEAVLGSKIEIPTLTGRVHLTIPPGTSSGKVFRLKGKGIVNATAGLTGDQLVTVRIVLPEAIDSELSEFLRGWRERHSYNAGRK
ncbi:MAG: molecular chaperone DnaJ [Hyphomicrobium sp. 32-62-53]|nr:MAG: molecular chaperone DnaJ [Hyphomicrobium sp. 12-62-95]OYY01661.1 MAG: molecular chaperone DnaJ [Hyphomicrobium sp. 32-62-53]